MNRIIKECPMCGTWDGPADGEASSAVSQICDECQPCQCGHAGAEHNNADKCLAERTCSCAAYDPIDEGIDHAA